MTIYFYTLSDPRTPDVIRYIGKTTQKLQRRLDQHVSASKRAKQTNQKSNYNINWINSLLSENIRPIIIEIDSFDSDKESKSWVIFEQYWISQFKTWGFNITNLTKGGDGNQNQIFSEESLRKRSEKLKGIPRPQEVKDRISESHKGKIKTQEHINNIKQGNIKAQGRAINQYSLEGEFIKTWDCVSDAGRFFNTDRSSIARCCKGQFKKSAGFKWRYKDEDIV